MKEREWKEKEETKHRRKIQAGWKQFKKQNKLFQEIVNKVYFILKKKKKEQKIGKE